MLDSSWLIPGLPLLGATFIGFLLISFSKTMNRLTKPSSFVIITCTFFSTLISFLFYRNHISGDAFSINFSLQNINIEWGLYIDEISSATSTVVGSVALVIMFSSYKLLDRKIGYVRYFVLLGILLGFILLFIFSGDLFHELFYSMKSNFKVS